ncbi:hypothetical protein CEUSTIGMA_g13880.t1 [Chlamydomonas eustigma]|uniref:Uncharacterized protein n=1 Tax=Chlamydomonas eustigma TaxID=1157962 RepID=A0A250XUI1_9CHLO|nr:hypothetical protein CEUSTIGMA_g13880.t1 [Chlamydomonas eustigma]|eukprot:GAX86470.1 hypothetical protein CEUSTIGMA_g13880.t1 [Chlamydomonas eustigma]
MPAVSKTLLPFSGSITTSSLSSTVTGAPVAPVICMASDFNLSGSKAVWLSPRTCMVSARTGQQLAVHVEYDGKQFRGMQSLSQLAVPQHPLPWLRSLRPLGRAAVRIAHHQDMLVRVSL